MYLTEGMSIKSGTTVKRNEHLKRFRELINQKLIRIIDPFVTIWLLYGYRTDEEKNIRYITRERENGSPPPKKKRSKYEITFNCYPVISENTLARKRPESNCKQGVKRGASHYTVSCAGVDNDLTERLRKFT